MTAWVRVTEIANLQSSGAGRVGILWVCKVPRRNGATEEVQLRKLLGAQYEAYARRTASLLPGID